MTEAFPFYDKLTIASKKRYEANLVKKKKRIISEFFSINFNACLFKNFIDQYYLIIVLMT